MTPPERKPHERLLRSLRREPPALTWFLLGTVAAFLFAIAIGVMEFVGGPLFVEGQLRQPWGYALAGLAWLVPLVLTALIHRRRRSRRQPRQR